jgi:hypothetical protein
MRGKLISLPAIALTVAIYFLRAQITALSGHNLNNISLLGVPILTDWGSVLLIVIFGLDLVVSAYGLFLNVPHLSVRIRKDVRNACRIPMPVTIIACSR